MSFLGHENAEGCNAGLLKTADIDFIRIPEYSKKFKLVNSIAHVIEVLLNFFDANYIVLYYCSQNVTCDFDSRCSDRRGVILV